MFSYIPQSNINGRERAPTPIPCTRCSAVFHSHNRFLMTCPACCKRDLDYTVRLGNQARIFQIDAALMNIKWELSIQADSNDRKDVLEKLVAQLEQEKLELSKNV
jgi:predicted  nucleic acid-binding Zn-ribbon protein